MFYYYNALQTKSGDILPDYLVRLLDASGNEVDIYADDSSTPIISVSGVANAAKADDLGMVRFFVPNGTYDIAIYDTTDTFKGREEGVPMYEAGTLTTDLSDDTGAALVGSTGGITVQASLDARPTSATLAASGGAALVGFIQSGTGSTARTASAKMLESPASPEDFSGDDSAALLAAATASREVRLARGATYTLTSLVDLSALNGRRIYMNGATIEADASFTDTHLLSMSGDSEIIGPGTFDGTNVDAPTGAYASGDYPGVGIYITGTGNDGLIEGVTFTNFQSGPILHDSATTRSGFRVRKVILIDNQKYTANATNALVAMHGVSNGLMEDCRAETYNWKAFYFTNGSFNKIVRCHANGGVIGHASHFLAGGSDNSIIDCSHEGTGFGVKVDGELRPSVINFKLQSGRCAIYMQSSTDFEIVGGQAFDPEVQAIIIDAANGNCNGTVVGFRGSRTTPGSTGSHVGILLQSFAAGVVSGVTISNCYFRNFLWGIYAPNVGFACTDISILANEFRNTGQYGILAYIGSGVISGNLIEMDSAAVEAAIHVERDAGTTTVTNTSGQPTLTVTAGVIPRVGDTVTGTGVPADTRIISVAGSAVTMSTNSTANVASVMILGNVEISNNVMRGCTADNIELLTRLHHKSIRVINNRSDGGTVFLNFSCNGNAADTVSVLEVVGNQGVGVTTGCSLTFNTTTSTRLRLENNNFVNTSFAPVANSLTNLTNVTSLATSQRGTATLAAGTASVSLPIAEPNTSYRISLSGNAAETFSWASKATGGFTINSSNAGSTASVDWVISR